MATGEQETTSDMGFFHAEPRPFSRILDSCSGEKEQRDVRRSSQGEEDLDGNNVENDRRNKLCGRGHWRRAEDAKLKELVSRHGPQNWNLIAQKLQGRSGKSCRLRWLNQLDPTINRRAFSEDEEERLLAAHRLYGNKWAFIARLFPGRTDNAVKNHWHVVMARKQRQQSNARGQRKPPACSSIPRKPEVSPSSNACSGESATTATREESTSTCTDLSLSSFHGRTVSIAHQTHSYRALKCISSSSKDPCCLHCHLRGLDPESELMSVSAGSDGRPKAERSGLYEKKLSDSCGNFFSHGAPPASAPGLHHSGLSGPAVASASEPVAHQVTHALLYGLKKQGRESFRLPFIDFLGVGAT